MVSWRAFVPDSDVFVRGQSLQSLKWLMGLNVVLAVLAYRGLLTFQPRMYSARTRLTTDAEQYLFTPTETAPLIIVLLSLWLVYHRRVALFALPERSGPLRWVAPLFASGVVIYLWAVYTSAPDIQALSLICNVVGCLVLWRGLPAARIALVPILLLLFAVPLPSPVIAKLIWNFQLATAVLSGWMLYMLGIPHVVSGEMIYLPQDTYQVIESCSGFRSVQTLSMFSILMCDLFDRGRGQMALMFLVSLPIAFFMNGIRVTTLILNPHSQIHSIHVAQGLLILVGGLILLYLLDGLFQRFRGGAAVRPLASSIAAAAADATRNNHLAARPRVLTVSGLVLTMLLVLHFSPVWSFHGRSGLALETTIARATQGWDAQELPGASNDLAKISFRQSLRRQYSKPVTDSDSALLTLRGTPAPIEVFVGVGEHLDRFKTPFSPKNAYPGRGWVVEEQGTLQLEGTRSPIAWRRLRSGTRRVISYHWYEAYRGLAEESFRSFFALDRSPFARVFPVTVVRLSTEIDEVSAAEMRRAHERLEGFHALLVEAIEGMRGDLTSAGSSDALGIPDFPLWVRLFPFQQERDVLKFNEFKYLSYFKSVA